MNRIKCLVCFLFLFTTAVYAQKWTSADFAIPLNQLVSSPNQIWVNSGFTTVRPTFHTVCGVNGLFSPPYYAGNVNVIAKFTVNNHAFTDNGEYKSDNSIYATGTWMPDKIIRKGTYHRVVDGNLISLGFTSILVPLSDEHGYVLKTIITNRTDTTVAVKMQQLINPGSLQYLPLDKWGFSIPSKDEQPKKISDNEWEGVQAKLQCFQSDTNSISIIGHHTASVYTALILTDKIINSNEQIDFEQQFNKSVKSYQQRLDRFLKNVPILKSNIPGLDDYYKRSLVSGLVCIWQNPAFVFNPYLSTSGIDGGGVNFYLWDCGYIPKILTLMLDNDAGKIISQFSKIKLDEYYSFAPAGNGTGVPYSYSTSAFLNLVWNLAQQKGFNPELFEEAKRLVAEQESLPKKNGLIDFGTQLNLLEMRNAGYEHYVVSPNAERAENLRRLADLNNLQQKEKNQSNQWRKEAEGIIAAVRKELWDDRAGWFVSKYPGGHTETVYTIQIFDAMQSGACTSAMQKKVLAHLKNGKFLFPYGVSSISAEDSLRFEYNDTDWGGSGAYIGDGPQLCQMLYNFKKPALAWNILSRYFWMGQQLPYYPQEAYVEKPLNPSHKRANTIAGLTGAETILYYLVGFEPSASGELYINPQMPAAGKIFIKGFNYRNHTIDTDLSSHTCKIMVDGKVVYSGFPKKIKLIGK